MSRRRRPEQRKILPDAKYASLRIAKFMNIVMVDGKKSIAEKIVYGALDIAVKKADKSLFKAKKDDATDVEGGSSSTGTTGFSDPVLLFDHIIKAVSPVVEVKSRRVGGSTYQVPVEVRPKRSEALAMRWIVTFASKRNEKTMELKLANEFLDVLANRGNTVKKREDTHKMAEANKAFSHFRF